ncbi:DNA-3-methyladenine glycosylase II [Psychromicrobium silvestre]|uniref:DNA-3-methyladenine glycosylase II n=1 Tax=Psychromicrobium silvestre TaxID=1645614 RepID=A0A7Y9LR66_9MICC|nr:DNA-3-methyladenine glycosylase 2 family protein [Psychromicrobium silvestre]NYE94094.1 DNA-3-methyladenine glycosylase II [Psychromicrobium silvestre]
MGVQSLMPQGPFDLANQNSFFGGWPTLAADNSALVVALPIEGRSASAAVVVSQDADAKIQFEVHGTDQASAADQDNAAVEQVRAALSLDIDAREWPEVGRKEQQIGQLQDKYGFLRPVLFNSPYEAAAHFIIGHRVSMQQARVIRARMAEQLGARIEVRGESFAAFPDSERLLEVTEFPGLNSTKIQRLHGVARAALDGVLNRNHLRSLSVEEALAQLRTIEGIGPFFASGILNRGAGVVDGVTDDELTKYAVKLRYGLAEDPTQAEVLRIAENWAPFRMWAEVLLHIWLRREAGLPRRRPR